MISPELGRDIKLDANYIWLPATTAIYNPKRGPTAIKMPLQRKVCQQSSCIYTLFVLFAIVSGTHAALSFANGGETQMEQSISNTLDNQIL
jgi:hypothetical protein